MDDEGGDNDERCARRDITGLNQWIRTYPCIVYWMQGCVFLRL